jgi:uncharacterized protein YggE
MSITVTGYGSVMAVPDVLRLGLGVEVTRPTAVEALSAAAQAVSALNASLDAAGVAPEDVRTEQVSLGPQQQHVPVGTGFELRMVGFGSSTVLAVTLRDSARAGPVIDAAIAAAGDAGRIHWIQHQQSDVDALQVRARDAAFADARSKAEQFASLAGLTLGGVTSISEGDAGHIYAVTASGGGQTQVSPGRQVTMANVTVVFEASAPA